MSRGPILLGRMPDFPHQEHRSRQSGCLAEAIQIIGLIMVFMFVYTQAQDQIDIFNAAKERERFYKRQEWMGVEPVIDPPRVPLKGRSSREGMDPLSRWAENELARDENVSPEMKAQIDWYVEQLRRGGGVAAPDKSPPPTKSSPLP